MIESSFFTSLIGFFIVLTPLIFFHELGHYYAAIKSGVKVESFSIGFGPEMFGYTDKKNTRWKFSLIPLGGYVKMKGELVNTEIKIEKKSMDKDTFLQASLFSRFFIVLSGPLANLILGLLLISSLYVFNGRYITPPIISEVLVSKPAMQGGILSGDRVISINKQEINNFSEMKNIVENNNKKTLNQTLNVNKKTVVDINILLNRVKLEEKNEIKRKIIFFSFVTLVISMCGTLIAAIK